MDAAQTIRDSVARVSAIRANALENQSVHLATKTVKAFQAKRFAGTYVDLLASTEYSAAANFFLEDLYSDKDYSQRDAQFSRIAGALQTLFPHQVVATAVSLAQLHLMTEELDLQMALAWLDQPPSGEDGDICRYVTCWRRINRNADRIQQLETVLRVGNDLDRLTRTPGLRLMLRMMRRPATAAGLGSLQSFLESGFDTFSSMSGKGARAKEFLHTIQNRETAWIEMLGSGEVGQCQSALKNCIADARKA
jgi:hypothetical protein